MAKMKMLIKSGKRFSKLKNASATGGRFGKLKNLRNVSQKSQPQQLQQLQQVMQTQQTMQAQQKPAEEKKEEEHQSLIPGISSALQSFVTPTMGAAAKLESQRIAFDHLTSKLQGLKGGKGGKGKGKGVVPTNWGAFWDDLRTNAQMTAFSADDVFSSGMQAIKLTKGDAGKAKVLLQLAEDMAGANPGKTVAEAMEALVEAKEGKYDKVQEFGLEPKSKGWKSFQKEASTWFKGGTDKLANSASGMWDIITDGLQMSLQNAGIAGLDKVKPELAKFVQWLKDGGFKKIEEIATKTVDLLVRTFLWLFDIARPLFEFLGEAIGWINDNFDALKPIIVGLAAAFATFVVITEAIALISSLGAVIALLSNPIFWIAAAVGLLVAAWYGNWFNIRGIVADTIDWLVNAFNAIKQWFSNALATINTWFSNLMTALAAAKVWFINLWNQISSFMSYMKTVFVTVWQNTMGQVLTAASSMWSNVVSGFQYIRQAVTQAMGSVWNDLKNIWSTISNMVSTNLGIIVNMVKTSFGAVSNGISLAMNTIKGIVSAVMDMMRGIFKGVWLGVAGDHAAAWATIKQAVGKGIQQIFGLLQNFASGAVRYGVQFASAIIGGILQLGQSVKTAGMKVWGLITSIMGKLTVLGAQILGSLVSTISANLSILGSTLKSVMNYLVSLHNKFWTAVLQILIAGVQKILPVLQAAWSATWAFLTNVFGKVKAVFVQGLQTIAGYIQQGWAWISAAVQQGIQTVIGYIQQGLAWLSTAVPYYLGVVWNAVVNAFNSIKSTVMSGMNTINEFISLAFGIMIGAFLWAWRLAGDIVGIVWTHIYTAVMNGINNVKSLFQSFMNDPLAFGLQFIDAFRQGLLLGVDPLMQTLKDIWDDITGLFTGKQVSIAVQGVNGTHKNGLGYVPFDGYLAQLHKGEMVLPAAQADAYRSGTLSPEQTSAMLYPTAGAPSVVNQQRSVEVAQLVGEIHVHNEADEDRFIDKLKRMLEEDLLTEGEGVHVG